MRCFMEDILIPRSEWEEFASAGSFSVRSISAFECRLGIAPGIVVGRLQHEMMIPFNRFNSLKRHLKWA